MKYKSRILILAILIAFSVLFVFLSTSTVSAEEYALDATDSAISNKINPNKVTGGGGVPNQATIKPLTMAQAKKFVKSQKSYSSTSKTITKQAYDYKSGKMKWFTVGKDATIDQYPAGLKQITKNSKSKVTYKIVANTKTKTTYNKKTKVTTTVKYEILHTIKKSKEKVVKVTTTTSKQSSKTLANKYLQPSTAAQVNNAKIKALAKAITKGCKSNDYYGKAKKIYRWVQVNIDYTLDADTSATAILSKKGSNGHYKAYCVGFSNVMAALCRAVDVPVRYRAILFFQSNEYPFEGHSGHVYSQVYVKGRWVNADAATVGFIAPLGYTGSLHKMHTDPGGSYFTADNKANYWDFDCDHVLYAHKDFNITKEVNGVPVLEYMKLGMSVPDLTTAYNILNNYASSNGYLIYKTNYFTGSSDYLTPYSFTNIYAYHYYDGITKKFLGYLIIDKNGVLYPALETPTIIPYGMGGVPISFYKANKNFVMPNGVFIVKSK